MEINRSDIELINDILSGSKVAFKILYKRYVRNHMLTCLRYVKNKSDAEDILQESYIKIFKDLKQYNPQKAKYSTWSNKVVINTCLMKIRKKNIFKDFKDIIEEGAEMGIESNAINQLSLQELTKIILELPKGYRTVFNMFVIDGFSHKEIAEKLNISESTSKSQLMKAKITLQKKLNPKDSSQSRKYA